MSAIGMPQAKAFAPSVFAEWREHVFVETTAEAFGAGKPHSVEFESFRFLEHIHFPGSQNFFHLISEAALVIVIPEHRNHRNATRAKLVGQLLSFGRQAQLSQVSAQCEHIRVLRNLFE